MTDLEVKEESPVPAGVSPEEAEKIAENHGIRARRSWAAYKSIEEDLLRITEYIPLETKQYTVFSFKLADIIIRSCTQIESLFKELIREKLLLEDMPIDEYQNLKKELKMGKSILEH